MRLRIRILVFTVLPLALLAAVILATVERGLSRRTAEAMPRDLEAASGVVEHVLGERQRGLEASARVMARDPRLFAALSLASHQHPGVALDHAVERFGSLAGVDAFAVFDPSGRALARSHRSLEGASGLAALVDQARHGNPASGLVVRGRTIYQASATPVIASGRSSGILVFASACDRGLARRLSALTRGAVTFVGNGEVGASTFTSDPERRLAGLAAAGASSDARAGTPRATTVASGFLDLAAPLPGSSREARGVYVLQRPIAAELGFLRAIRSRSIEIALITILAAMLAGWLAAQVVVTPLRRLVAAATAMERGDYERPIGVRSHDEIGYLARRFEEMREHERQRISALRGLTRMRSEFIGMASRELRSPIETLGAFRDQVRGLGSVNPRQAQALDAIHGSVSMLERIARDASRLAQIEDDRLLLEPAELDLTELLRGAALQAVGLGERRKVNVRLDLSPKLGAVDADGPRLTEAVVHLVTNGIRFTPDGGSVMVRARREGETMVIEVRDNGIGIPLERQRHLFERAFAVRDSLNHHSSSGLEFRSAGLGLGLAIARGIVEAHRGTIHVESTVGHGSTFTIRLPVRAHDSERAA
jgi:signal transduction histidine kinase